MEKKRTPVGNWSRPYLSDQWHVSATLVWTLCGKNTVFEEGDANRADDAPDNCPECQRLKAQREGK